MKIKHINWQYLSEYKELSSVSSVRFKAYETKYTFLQDQQMSFKIKSFCSLTPSSNTIILEY